MHIALNAGQTGMTTSGAPDCYEVPSSGRGVAPIARLHDRLDRATGGVALVCAPAGYGKTTQVALWAANDDRPVAWADLGSSDNDPGVLTSRLASMLQALTQTDRRVAELYATTAHVIVVPAVTEMVRLVERPVVVVLDNIHVIDDPKTLDVLGAVVNSVPAGSTLVLIGHSEPDMSLGRLRVEDRVEEIVATDLALTAPDARGIFESVGLDVDDARLDQCVAETEGWPIGLRLAALALRDDADIPGGSLARDRVLAESVYDEWLRGLDRDDMDFLLRVSGLEWMSGSLCDEVLGRSDSGARLERLHRSRRLVAPLDRRGDAYRMHGLLRDVLDAHFERLDRTARRAIDRSASAWFERNDDIDRAVRHAVRAGDGDLIEQLVVRYAATIHTRGRSVTVRRWLDQIPAMRIPADPALCLVAALTSVGLGEAEEARAWVRLGIAASQPATGSGTASTACLELLALQSLLSLGPIGDHLPGATRAYEQISSGVWHAAACQAVGVLSLGLGLTDLAESRLAEGAAEAHVTGAVTVRAICRSQLAVIVGERGDWAAATAIAREARQLIRHHELDIMPTLIVVTAMSAHVEALAGDLVAARADLLLTRRNLAYVGGISAWANVQARVSLAHASLLLSDRAGARVLVDEAEAYLQVCSDAGGAKARLQEIVERLECAREALPVGPSSLTTAEVRVLHLLPTNLSIADIAQRLYVSRNTAKSHAAAVYRKLGVSSRRDAVSIARDVGLLPP